MVSVGRNSERDDGRGAGTQLLRTSATGSAQKELSFKDMLKGRRKLTAGSLVDHQLVHVTTSAESD